MQTRTLKDYRGFNIIKSWEDDKRDIVYTACTCDGDLFDCDISLQGLKRRIDAYID